MGCSGYAFRAVSRPPTYEPPSTFRDVVRHGIVLAVSYLLVCPILHGSCVVAVVTTKGREDTGPLLLPKGLFCITGPPRGAISTPALGMRASAHADDTASIRRIGLGCLSTPHSCQDSPSCCRHTRQAHPRKHHSGPRTSRCLILDGAYRRRTHDRTPWLASGGVRRLCARVAVGIEQTLRQHFFAL